MNRILVIGSSNTDMIVKLDRIPRPGETVIGGQFTTAAGGKGANQAVAAARAGGAVTFIASLGADSLGDKAVAGFKADGIDVRRIKRVKNAASGVALIFVGKDGQNSIAVASGANELLLPPDLSKCAAEFGKVSVVLAQLETPLETVLAAAERARKAGALFILNPAPAQKLPRRLLSLVSVLTPNEIEAEVLSGVKVVDAESAREAARKLRRAGAEAVIVTLGAKGAWVSDASTEQLIPAPRVKAVDTTAAGDVFNGALAVALAEGRQLLAAARFATVAAAISVTRIGAQPSAPWRKEIDG